MHHWKFIYLKYCETSPDLHNGISYTGNNLLQVSEYKHTGILFSV